VKNLRILIADDHGLVRRGARAVLRSRLRWRVVGEAANGREAVKKAAIHPLADKHTFSRVPLEIRSHRVPCESRGSRFQGKAILHSQSMVWLRKA
jgi:CheY-like chemotaxis protein